MHQSRGVLPVWAERLGQGSLQGLSAVMDVMRARFTPRLAPSFAGMQLGALGRSRPRGEASRPPHVAAGVRPTGIEDDGPRRGGNGWSPLASKALTAGAIPPRQAEAAAPPRGRLHGRIPPQPFVAVRTRPRRPRPPRTPAAPRPALQAKAGLIPGPHAWPLPRGEGEADGLVEPPSARPDPPGGGGGAQACAWSDGV